MLIVGTVGPGTPEGATRYKVDALPAKPRRGSGGVLGRRFGGGRITRIDWERREIDIAPLDVHRKHFGWA